MYLTASKSIAIFGWWDQPRTVLVWDDIKTHSLTWRQLRTDFGFHARQLKAMQPDKTRWICQGGLRLEDLPDATVFPVNPVTDMLTDIGELIRMQWRHDTIAAMGVTYAQLQLCGVTPRIMRCFRYPLTAWLILGLDSSHVNTWNNDDCVNTFGVAQLELLSIIDGY